jgi:hypothetical protein
VVKIEAHSLFGKKPLIQEQEELYFTFGNLSKGILWADPRIAETYYAESLLRAFSPKSRRKNAIRQFNKALFLFNSIVG